MFARCHYKAIAEVLRANQPGELSRHDFGESRKRQQARNEHHRYIVHQLSVLFTQDNPRFDGDKFFTAATRPE